MKFTTTNESIGLNPVRKEKAFVELLFTMTLKWDYANRKESFNEICEEDVSVSRMFYLGDFFVLCYER